MATKHEAAVRLLHATLAGLIAPIPLALDDSRAAALLDYPGPPDGFLAGLVSGEPTAQDRILGGAGELIAWQQDVEFYLIGDGPDRRVNMDGLMESIGRRLDLYRVTPAWDWLEFTAAEPMPESALPGAASARGVTIIISLFYMTGANPLEGGH